MNDKGQGALEYLWLIGGAILVAVILITLLLQIDSDSSLFDEPPTEFFIGDLVKTNRQYTGEFSGNLVGDSGYHSLETAKVIGKEVYGDGFIYELRLPDGGIRFINGRWLESSDYFYEYGGKTK